MNTLEPAGVYFQGDDAHMKGGSYEALDRTTPEAMESACTDPLLTFRAGGFAGSPGHLLLEPAGFCGHRSGIHPPDSFRLAPTTFRKGRTDERKE